MSSATLHIGDVRDVMATMADGSVDLILTSPPFLALRSYLPADHPDKAKEIGSEPTPAAFLDTLLELTAEWGRLITPHGSIAVELGDTYSGSGGSGGDYGEGGLREGQSKFDGSARVNRGGRGGRASMVEKATGGHHMGGKGWPLDKSACLIPQLYAIALSYGISPLTGEPSPAGRWRVRNVVAWCRPNPPVGALGDKFRPATSYMTIATKARDRWFDLDAVRAVNNPERAAERNFHRPANQHTLFDDTDPSSFGSQNPAGAPPLDWWKVSTEAYPGSHYATWPRKLLDRPIQTMCPREVCTTCGEPRRRLTETQRTKDGQPIPVEDLAIRRGDQTGRTANSGGNWRYATERTDLGWTDCGHGTFRPGIVLDPFAGSGTTLAVATGHSRDAIGIDIDERNEHLVRERVGMFLTDVIDHRSPEVAGPDTHRGAA